MEWAPEWGAEPAIMTEVKRLKRMMTEETKKKKRETRVSDWLLDISSDFTDAKLDLLLLNGKSYYLTC